MKQLEIQNPGYRRLQKSYGEWLRLLNFEPSTVNYSPIKLAEFLHWLEANNITEINQVTRKVTAAYFDYLKARQNQRKGGKLSKNYLRTHLQTLRKFARYLRETEQESFEVAIQLKGTASNIKTILSREEISRLYGCIDHSLLGMRDRAMLAIYYGCGLRRSEGVSLDASDVLSDKNLLYVRKGKNYKERYVPMTAAVRGHLQEYINYARPGLLKVPNEALFLGRTGSRILSSAMAERFKKLLQRAEIDKPAGLHTLRHSIATHLLQSGMKLEQISRFLGHSSLESTQIYTHIVNEYEAG
jgi:integrase/recombinase XerD